MCWTGYRVHTLWETAGMPLRHLLNTRKEKRLWVSRAEFYKLAGQLVAGMMLLERHGITHRGLSTSHIETSTSLEIKIGDLVSQGSRCNVELVHMN